MNSLVLTRYRLLDHSLPSRMLLISCDDLRLIVKIVRVKSWRLLTPVMYVFLVLCDVTFRLIIGLVTRIILITDHICSSICEKEAGQMWSTLATSTMLLPLLLSLFLFTDLVDLLQAVLALDLSLNCVVEHILNLTCL